MEVSRHWRLKAQRYRLEGSACPICGQLAFPPRPVCPHSTGQPMLTNPASSITEAASKRTYYTIRWVDNILAVDSGSPSERRVFLERQKSLLESRYQGEAPQDINIQEKCWSSWCSAISKKDPPEKLRGALKEIFARTE
jgi:hypothetical protein